MRLKYGRISSELKKIPDDEPLFLIRAQDILAPAAVEAYAALLESSALMASPEVYRRLKEQVDEVRNIAASMIAYQAEKGCKLPD